MNKISHLTILGLIFFIANGCESNTPKDDQATTGPQSSLPLPSVERELKGERGIPAFSTALYVGYQKLASAERKLGNTKVSNIYGSYALKAAIGDLVQPEHLSNFRISGEAQRELRVAHYRLIKALEAGAREKAPAKSASAQVMLSCWLRKQEKVVDPPDVTQCRSGFRTAINRVESVVTKRIAKYTIYFPLNSAEPSNRSRQTMRNAIRRIKRTKNVRVILVGHTDKAGDAQSNLALAEKRVIKIQQSLRNIGVPQDAFNTASYGEARPLVRTKDGVPNWENRRVEIAIIQYQG